MNFTIAYFLPSRVDGDDDDMVIGCIESDNLRQSLIDAIAHASEELKEPSMKDYLDDAIKDLIVILLTINSTSNGWQDVAQYTHIIKPKLYALSFAVENDLDLAEQQEIKSLLEEGAANTLDVLQKEFPEIYQQANQEMNQLVQATEYIKKALDILYPGGIPDEVEENNQEEDEVDLLLKAIESTGEKE